MCALSQKDIWIFMHQSFDLGWKLIKHLEKSNTYVINVININLFTYKMIESIFKS